MRSKLKITSQINEDEKINFILLKKIGTTTKPYKNKIKLKSLKLNSNLLLNSNF